MRIVFSDHSWEEYQYWQQTDKKILKRINHLIKDTIRNPYKGIGDPEPLKHNLSGKWSRRINREHRFIYNIDGDSLNIFQLRFHY